MLRYIQSFVMAPTFSEYKQYDSKPLLKIEEVLALPLNHLIPIQKIHEYSEWSRSQITGGYGFIRR